MEPQDAQEQIDEAARAHLKADGQQHSKRIAVLIAALAAALALSETGGKNAQTEAVAANIAASDTWAFYQAKTIRMTIARSTADAVEALADSDPSRAAKVVRVASALRDEATRLDTDDQKHESRRALAEEATLHAEARDHHLARYRHFEYASAALQLAIVLASAAVVTGVVLLAWAAGGLGLIGAGFCTLGWFAPNLLAGFL